MAKALISVVFNSTTKLNVEKLANVSLTAANAPLQEHFYMKKSKRNATSPDHQQV